MTKIDAITIINDWNSLTFSGVEVYLELENNVLKISMREREGNLLLDASCYYKCWDASRFVVWLMKVIRETAKGCNDVCVCAKG